MLMGLASGTTKLRLGRIDENTERNLCLKDFFGDCSLFGGIDMANAD